MRKVCLILLLSNLITNVFAAYEPAEMSVTFDVEANDPAYIEFGFSASPDGQNRIEEFQIAVGNNEEKNTNVVYAYWNVISASSFELRLYCEPLISKDGNLLDWSVTWMSNESDYQRIGGEDEYGSENSNVIITRIAKRGEPLSAVGSKKLDIAVFSDAGQKAGDYSGQLVLQMESI